MATLRRPRSSRADSRSRFDPLEPQRLVVPLMLVLTVVTVTPVVALMVLAVPMSFVHLPAFSIMVVMRMGPVCSFKWRPLPVAADPLVMMTKRRPISLDPNEAGAGRRSRLFVNLGRWRRPNIHRNLS